MCSTGVDRLHGQCKKTHILCDNKLQDIAITTTTPRPSPVEILRELLYIYTHIPATLLKRK